MSYNFEHIQQKCQIRLLFLILFAEIDDILDDLFFARLELEAGVFPIVFPPPPPPFDPMQSIYPNSELYFAPMAPSTDTFACDDEPEFVPPPRST
jgi:hypothetical protein